MSEDTKASEPTEPESDGDTDDTESTESEQESPSDKPEKDQHSGEVERLLTAYRKKSTEAKQLRDKLAKNDTESAQKAEQATQQVQQIEQERDDLVNALTRERVGRRYGLPPEVCERLKGDSEEDITTDAKTMAKLLDEHGRTRVTNGQGKQSRGEADPNVQFRRLAQEAS